MNRRRLRMTPWSLVWLSAACATSAPPAPASAPVAVAPAPATAPETPSPPQRARCEPRPASEVIAALADPAPERSLDALCALRAMCEDGSSDAGCPRADEGLRVALRTALARPAAETTPRMQEQIILALASLRDAEASPLLRALVLRPHAEQEIRTLRAAADALGALRDVEGAEALVYGLYVFVSRANATNNCTRALVNIGADAAVPRLINTLRPEGNPRVTQLLRGYDTVPGMSPPPPGLQQAVAIDALRVFADPRAIDPLLALLRDDPAMRLPGQGQVGTDVRAAAGETLAHTALTLAATDPRRAQVFDAIAAVFRAGSASERNELAPLSRPPSCSSAMRERRGCCSPGCGRPRCAGGRGSRTASGSSCRSRAPCATQASRPLTCSRAPRRPTSPRCSPRTLTRPRRFARCARSSRRSARWPASPGTAPTETSGVTA